MMRSLRGLAAPLLKGLNQRRRQAPSGREEGMARLPKGNLQNDRSRSIRQDVFFPQKPKGCRSERLASMPISQNGMLNHMPWFFKFHGCRVVN